MPKQICKHNHDTIIVGRDKSGNCNICQRMNRKKWREANPEKAKQVRDSWNKRDLYKRKEGMWAHQGIKNLDGTKFREVDYRILHIYQDGKCAICKRKDIEFKRHLAVDHDHLTGHIRGLLCLSCNRGLGLFKDNPAFTDDASLYLRRIENDSVNENNRRAGS